MAFTHLKRIREFAIPGPQDMLPIAEKWLEKRKKRTEIAALLNQDEAILKDIGITRGDVREALSASGDPSLNLRVLAAKRRFWSRNRERI